MSNNKIELRDHLICGSAELEDYIRYNLIKPWQPRNPRHQLFHKIKYPRSDFYSGGWGPELLVVRTDPDVFYGPQAIIHATQARADEIRRWIVDNLFEYLTN